MCTEETEFWDFTSLSGLKAFINKKSEENTNMKRFKNLYFMKTFPGF
jgi:hypothetical protein